MARDSEEARRLAADPTTDWGTLYELAQTNPEVHAAIAANPATYPDLLAWLATLDDPDVTAALARRADTDLTHVAPPEDSEPDHASTQVLPDHASTEVLDAAASPAPPVATPATTVPPTVERVPVARAFGHTAEVPPAVLPPLAAAPPLAEPPTASHLPAFRAESAAMPRNRRPLIAALAFAGVLAVAAGAWLLSRGDDTPAPASAPTAPLPTAPVVETPRPTTGTAPEDNTAALTAAAAALSSTFATSSCADPGDDAAALATWANARLAVSFWDKDATQFALSAISSLQARCNAGYAVAVADRAGAQSPELVSALGARTWVTPAVPAPANAAEITAFSSPTGNIACVLGDDRVTCSIRQYSFSSPPACADQSAPVTVVLDSAGARADCAIGAISGGPALPYGNAARHSHFACTSEESGVTCWDTWTGARLRLARATVELSGPIQGAVG